MLCGRFDVYMACALISFLGRGVANLGGFGGMIPRKFLKFHPQMNMHSRETCF